MIDFLTNAVAFILALSVLIAVHEFGHYWVARRMGVKVLRFSIGFGKPLWSVRRGPDQTEYAIASIPLGGYVKMVDEREGEVAPEDLPRAFNRQPVSRRFAIVAAGPLFNLGFAIVAYWLMFVAGVPGLRPFIGELSPESIAARAGLEPGMEIVAVDDVTTPTWGAVMDAVLPNALRQEPVKLTVREQGREDVFTLPLNQLSGGLEPEALNTAIGLAPYRPWEDPVIGQVVDDSPAQRAGIKPGDRIISIDEKPIADWEQLSSAVRASSGNTLRIRLAAGDQERVVEVRPDSGDDGYSIGVGLDPAMFATHEYGPLAAIGPAAERTWEMSTLTLGMIGEMLVGRASVENISGPISIARYAGATASAGLAQFLGFLAVVSVSLGVLNLLPIPILDGGHLMFYTVEAIRRRPASEKAEMLAQRIGMMVIVFLMLVAFYNDLVRLAG